MVEFSTLSDYLFLLRTISEASGPHGPGIMFYLAAAVSDFYIPDEKMVCCFAILFVRAESQYSNCSSGNTCTPTTSITWDLLPSFFFKKRNKPLSL